MVFKNEKKLQNIYSKTKDKADKKLQTNVITIDMKYKIIVVSLLVRLLYFQ